MRTAVSFASAALSFAVVLASFEVRAAPAPVGREPTRESPDERQYRLLLDQAVAEYDGRQFEEARALFRRAHEISPNARTLRGMGMASFELRDYVEALRSLEGALAEKRRPLTATQRQQVQALAERARVFVGNFHVRLSPRESVLRVDGADAALDADDRLQLGFGRHLLTAEAPGRRSEYREITVVGGERQELLFELAPSSALGASGRSPTRGAPATTAPGAGPHATNQGSSGTGWWFAGAGLLAGSAVGGALWWRFENHQLARCDDALAHGGLCSNQSILRFRERLALAVAIGSAAGALALGTIGAVKWARGGNTESGLAVACAPGWGKSKREVGCELAFTF
jgi:hypothetical protein